MYSPPYNRIENRTQQIELMRANNFAILVTAIDGGLSASHLVCMVEERASEGVERASEGVERASEGVERASALLVVGHMAKTNPQWQEFFDDDAMVIFHGPHAYVSPRWYEQQERVPTWNYAAVHAYGKPRVIEAREAKHAVMRRLVALQDPQWLPKFEALRPEYVQQMLDGIVAFEIEVTRLETRWKLSQNRGRREQELIIAELEKSSDSAQRATAALTRRHLADGG
jgi:transcriptional regulator